MMYREMDAANDDLIFEIATNLMLEPSGHESDTYLERLLDPRLTGLDPSVVIRALRDVVAAPESRNMGFAQYIVDTKNRFLLRLFAVLCIGAYESLVSYGAVYECPGVFEGLAELRRRIMKEVQPVLQMRSLRI